MAASSWLPFFLCINRIMILQRKLTVKKVKSYRKRGWRKKMLQVDLSDAKIWEEALPEELVRNYTGGAGKISECECPAIDELLAQGD